MYGSEWGYQVGIINEGFFVTFHLNQTVHVSAVQKVQGDDAARKI